MEVFVGYRADDDFAVLEKTLDCWDACGFEVAGVECPTAKYEITRRIAAENLAKKSHYILADLGCIPEERAVLKNAITERLMGADGGPGLSYNADNPALIGLISVEDASLPCQILGGGCHPGCPWCDRLKELRSAPTGVRILRKGVVDKWLPKSTDTYDQEHAESVRLAAGANWYAAKVIEVWPDIFYKHLPVH